MARRGGGFPGAAPGNMQNMMKQVQKMQKDMEKIQAELGVKEVEASVGGGAIVVTANGNKEIISIKIKPEVLDPEDVEMLEDLVLTAVNQALKSADDMMNQGMGKVTGGMGIPGLF